MYGTGIHEFPPQKYNLTSIDVRIIIIVILDAAWIIFMAVFILLKLVLRQHVLHFCTKFLHFYDAT